MTGHILHTRQPARAAALAILTIIASWLGMQILHEAGHILHAWLSGATVLQVVLHPLAISRTDTFPPSPWITWGGPLWGCLLPLGLHWTARGLNWSQRHLTAFFAGFCLIANGAYLAAGILYPVGDAVMLLQQGTPSWALLLFGLITAPAGFWFWNGLGIQFGLGREARTIGNKEILRLLAFTLLIVIVEVALSAPL